MLSWKEYIEKTVKNYEEYNKLEISIDGFPNVTNIPSIVLLSLELNKITDGNLGLILPKSFVYVYLMAVLYQLEIISKINFNDNIIDQFKSGELLKCGNSIVEFDKVDYSDGIGRIWVRTADTNTGIPLESAPLLQYTKTKKKLSKDKKFNSEHKRQTLENMKLKSDGIILKAKRLKTHVNSSVCIVTNQGKFIDFIKTTTINKQPLIDLLYTVRLDYNGGLIDVSTGKLEGIPSIVIASDIYKAHEYIESHDSVKQLIVDITDATDLEAEYYTHQKIKEYGVKTLFISDLTKKTDIIELEKMNASIWEWTRELVKQMPNLSLNNKLDLELNNYVNHDLECIHCPNDKFAIVYDYIREIKSDDDLEEEFFDAYIKLVGIFYRLLLIPIIIDSIERENIINKIYEIRKEIEANSKRICSHTHKMLANLTENLIILAGNRTNDKSSLLRKLISQCSEGKVAIIIKNRADKKRVEDYILRLHYNKKNLKVVVKTVQEYKKKDSVFFDAVICSGWFGENHMKSIFYSNKTAKIKVLLYEIEEHWRKTHTRNWAKFSIKSSNEIILKDVKLDFENSNRQMIFTESVLNSEFIIDMDKLINTYQFSLYKTNSSHLKEKVIAVNFYEGGIAFFKKNHKLIVINDIIEIGLNRIQEKSAGQLLEGDIIVIRDSQKDIIREMADNILNSNGYNDVRQISCRWKEVLQNKLETSEFSELYYSLSNNGCSVTESCVRNWIYNDHMIMPNDFDHVSLILSLDSNKIHPEEVEKIYSAGKIVKSAHVSAGKKLSELLYSSLRGKYIKSKFVNSEMTLQSEIELEVVGKIKVLKIDKITNNITIDASYANKFYLD
ncbi:DrmE family protein [Fusibacter ferrireducens]|uniref:DISARM protein DrmE C-terminal domain-containing protein n=1 Tax=Fusibacter ferrireducens TaxID=2785058 RepID=A0ABR9ZMN8_9FIRM|nr:DrmE family protein [Fusibacter ferrireducens]MBF4691581.1 hypothetical protein [Fusibacter ferrireducens]